MTKTAILFAGQGAQTVGMGRDLAEAFSECRAIYDRANSILGYDLARICFEGPESDLVKSNHCQPAIFVTSLACYAALRQHKPALEFAGAAGLSLGEWTALAAAEAMSFEDALRTLEARGRFMQAACEERAGAMLSVIGLAVEPIAQLAAAAGVEVANLNSPEQTVLSGERLKIQAAEKLAAAAGAKRTIMLNVAGAYHSSLMASAAGKLKTFMRDIPIHPPRMPVVANVTGAPHGAPDDIRRTMVRQVTSAVKWVDCIQWFKSNGITRYVECGPGKALCGLVKRIHLEAALFNVQDRSSLDKTIATLN